MKNAKEMQLLIAIFGEKVTIGEARRVLRRTNRRNSVLSETFNLSEKQLGIICMNQQWFTELLQWTTNEKISEHEKTVAENLRQIEMRAMRQFRQPERERRRRALLASR